MAQFLIEENPCGLPENVTKTGLKTKENRWLVARVGDNPRHDSWQDPMFLSLLLKKSYSLPLFLDPFSKKTPVQ
jgi:hypothetical protein